MEGDNQVPLRELAVQIDKFIVGSFIPGLGSAPLSPELLLNLLRMIEGEVLVNGAPCAVQGACNPTIDRSEACPKG